MSRRPTPPAGIQLRLGEVDKMASTQVSGCNKVVYITRDAVSGDPVENVLIDLTGDNVTRGTVLKGYKFHGADGSMSVGTYEPPSGTPVLEAKTVTANGVYTPGAGVDGYSKVTVNAPQSGGGEPFSVAWGTALPETVVENQIFLVHLPESAEFGPVRGVFIGMGPINPSDTDSWERYMGVWYKKVLDPAFTPDDWLGSGILAFAMNENPSNENDPWLDIVNGVEAKTLCLVYPEAALQTDIFGGSYPIPSYIGRNGRWERFVTQAYQEDITWPEVH